MDGRTDGRIEKIDFMNSAHTVKQRDNTCKTATYTCTSIAVDSEIHLYAVLRHARTFSEGLLLWQCGVRNVSKMKYLFTAV